MRVALCIAGQLRGYKDCYPTIEEHIINPTNCDVFIKTWKPSQEWYKRQDFATEEDVKNTKNLVSYFMEDFQPFQENHIVGKEYHSTRDGASIPNVLSMYWNINQAIKLKQDHEKANDFIYDAVIYIRPDLNFKNDINVQHLEDSKNNDHIYLSVCFGDHGGYEDQMAFGSSKNMDIYGECFNNIDKYCKEDTCTFHPETILFKHFEKQELKANRTDIHYEIMRKDG